MRLLLRNLMLVGIPALAAATVLTSCEDDPILSPQSGSKPANGSYGNISVSPPVDSTANNADGVLPTVESNPEVN